MKTLRTFEEYFLENTGRSKFWKMSANRKNTITVAVAFIMCYEKDMATPIKDKLLLFFMEM